MWSNAKVVYSITAAIMFGGSSQGVYKIFKESHLEKLSLNFARYPLWSELVFSILNHPCSLMDYHFKLSCAFLSQKSIFFLVFFSSVFQTTFILFSCERRSRFIKVRHGSSTMLRLVNELIWVITHMLREMTSENSSNFFWLPPLPQWQSIVEFH